MPVAMCRPFLKRIALPLPCFLFRRAAILVDGGIMMRTGMHL